MRLSLAVLVVFLPLVAQAECQNDAQVFSCKVGKKTLQICHWKGALIYQFGPKDKWELSIAEPLETIDFTPWPGIGRYIWETVAFRNEGYTYEVRTSAERGPDATDGLQGGVHVLQGDATVAEVTCDPGTPSNSLDVIYDLKESIGQCWDFDTRRWQTACN
jgi:hypothetical protein